MIPQTIPMFWAANCHFLPIMRRIFKYETWLVLEKETPGNVTNSNSSKSPRKSSEEQVVLENSHNCNYKHTVFDLNIA